MSNPPKTREEIEEQVFNIQSKNKASTNGTENGNGTTKSDIAFGALGSFDRDIYGGQSVRGYDTSIAANDADFEEDEDQVQPLKKSKDIYKAQRVLIDEAARTDKTTDVFEDTRTRTIAEREDEYRQRGRQRVISPDRVDPFLVGVRAACLTPNSRRCWA